MKEKEPYAMDQSEQTTVSEQQVPASRNGVFLKRGKGQSFDEFKKVCIKSLIRAGLIKEGPSTPKAGSGFPTNEQILPDKKDQ